MKPFIASYSEDEYDSGMHKTFGQRQPWKILVRMNLKQ